MHEYVLVLIVAAAVTYLVTPFIRSLAVATGAFTAVRERDVHTTPIPRLGGVGIYIGFVAAALVARGAALPRHALLDSGRSSGSSRRAASSASSVRSTTSASSTG